MTWPHIAIAWVALSLPVLAFMKGAHRSEPPAPVKRIIPDAEFEKLFAYAKKEAFLDLLERQLKAFPENDGRTFALLELDVLRAENQFSLMTFAVPKS